MLKLRGKKIFTNFTLKSFVYLILCYCYNESLQYLIPTIGMENGSNEGTGAYGLIKLWFTTCPRVLNCEAFHARQSEVLNES